MRLLIRHPLYKFMSKKILSTHYYNIIPDLPNPLPLPKNKNGELVKETKTFSLPICEELKRQEFSQEREIKIPEPIFRFYQRYRPTPLVRALRLESYLKTPAKIFYKNESASFSGNHKLNTAIATAYYAKKQGFKQIISGMNTIHSALALGIAGNYFGIRIKVFLPQKNLAENSALETVLKIFNVEVISVFDKDLSDILARAVNEVKKNSKSVYGICSFLNHTLFHQTIIGQEAKRQMQEICLTPDVIIGCCGGGSNLGGIATPFLEDILKGKSKRKKPMRFIAVEPDAYPSLTKGEYAYHFVDQNKILPQFMMYSYSNPLKESANGLKFHGVSPIISYLYNLGFLESRTYDFKLALKAALIFARKEGIVPAPESAYAIRAVIDEAKKCKANEEKVILFNLSGHGSLDLQAYADFFRKTIS